VVRTPRLVHEAVAVKLHGLGGDPKERRDLLGGLALRDELKNFPLTRGQLAAEHLGRIGARAGALELVAVGEGSDVIAAFERHADGADQFDGGRLFGDVAHGAGAERGMQVGGIELLSNEDDFDLGVRLG